MSSYLAYQGEKFKARFDPLCYVRLTQLLDSHDVGRGRGGVPAALASLNLPALVVAFDSDVLYPLDVQRSMAAGMPRCTLEVVPTPHGHDGVLLELAAVNAALKKFLAASRR